MSQPPSAANFQQQLAAAGQQALLQQQQAGAAQLLRPQQPQQAWVAAGPQLVGLQQQQQQQQQQQRTVSPAPGQQPAAQQQQAAQLQQQLAAASKQGAGQIVNMNGTIMYLPAGVSVAQAQAMYAQQLQQQQQQQQQQLGSQVQRRPPGASTPPAAPKKPVAGSGGASLPASGSSSNLAASGGLQQQALQQQQQHLAQQAAFAAAAAAAAAAARGVRPPAVAGSLPAAGLTFATGARPAGYPGAPLSGVRPVGAGPLGIPGAAGASIDKQAHQHLQSLRPGEAPRVDPLPGTEWMQCMSKDGNPGWYAVPREKAAALRAELKRKAEAAAASAPAAKQAAGPGGVRRKVDDDVTLGGDMNDLDVLGADALQAELALNEAAKGAVVAEQGNVQEEYILNQGPTMTLVAKAAKQGGVKAVGEDVYAFLSLAAEAHLSQLLHSLVRMRLQREDLGKSYAGVEKVDDRLRSGLFQIQKREKEAARKREEEQRDKLVELGTKKKTSEEDKKAAKAAQTARQLEQQQKNLGTTLTKMGIGRRSFAMSALGRPAGSTPAAKAGFTKSEVLEAKAAATAPPLAVAGAADGSNTAAAAKAEPGVDAGAVSAGLQTAGSTAAPASGGAAPAPGVPPVKPVTLQHQLLNAANNTDGSAKQLGGVVPGFVAGGSMATRERDGEEGLREVMLADLIAVLERHPLYCRSQQLYALYALVGLTGSK